MTDEIKLCFSDLEIDELAEHAFNVFLYQGRHPLGARLTYEALKQNSSHPLALRCLSDLLNQEGLEVFSAITLEYALIHAEILGDDEARALYQILFSSKWAWGFATHISGKTELTPQDFANFDEFIVDHERYQEFIDHVIERAGDVESAFHSAHIICGIMAQFLEHNQKEKTAQFDEIFYPERFIENQNYFEWLNSYEPILEEMAAKRFVAQMKLMKNDTKS